MESGLFVAYAMTTWIELSAGAFAHNIALVHTMARGAALACVVKSNAYGHGMEQIIALIQQHPQITMICVAGIAEGIRARHAGWRGDILVLSYWDRNLEEVVKHALTVTLFDQLQVQELLQFVRAQCAPVRVHLKIDTGLSRIGFLEHEIMSIMTQLRAEPLVVCEGLYTHLADTNAQDDSFSREQCSRFDAVIQTTRAAGFAVPHVHVMGSGSLYLQRSDTLVRVGTSLYGSWKSDVQRVRYQAVLPSATLAPVLTWWTKVERVFEAAGRRYAVVPVGFAQGYPRACAHKAWCMVDGQRALVCAVEQEHMLVDVTLVRVQLGRVALVGAGVSWEEHVRATGLLANELSTNISGEIVREIQV